MINWIRQNPALSMVAVVGIIWIAMPPPRRTNRRQIERAEMAAWTKGHDEGYRDAKEDYDV